MLETSVNDNNQKLDDNEQGRTHYQLARICIQYFTMREILEHPILRELKEPVIPCLYVNYHNYL
jgi:hypothetical protein